MIINSNSVLVGICSAAPAGKAVGVNEQTLQGLPSLQELEQSDSLVNSRTPEKRKGRKTLLKLVIIKIIVIFWR